MSVWWPKIGEDIVQIVQQCVNCQKYIPSTAKEPMVPTVLPDRPWQMLGVDLLVFNWSAVYSCSRLLLRVYRARLSSRYHHTHSYHEIKVHILWFIYVKRYMNYMLGLKIFTNNFDITLAQLEIVLCLR